MNRTRKSLAWSGIAMLGAAACFFGASAFSEPESQPASQSAAARKAICVLAPTEGNAAEGVVTFEEEAGGVMIVVEVSGLEPNSKHGFHVHQYGDVSAKDGTATGGHFNPHAVDHAGPDADTRHVGDLGNLEADADGVARMRRLDTLLKLDGENSVIGRGVIVHAGEDDLVSQPTGDAGGRIAQGVVGIAKNE